ncbi:MAG: hypothetical protein IKU24_00340, partial [Clostridia bacterium]|nr:hypothetical protein [Clostridia bacterium]
QAYITVTIMLILLKLIDQILYQNAAFLEILKKGFLLLLTGLLGMLLYSAVLKAVLALFSIELLDYQGASGVSLSNLNLHASFYTIKETFLKTFFDVSAEGIVYVVLNGFVLAFSIFYYVKHIIGRKLYQKPLELFALLVLVIFLIPGAAILALINTEIDYHNLMRMGYVVFYLFFLLLYERGEEIDKKSAPAKCWIVFVVASLLVCNQIVISNTSYHKAQISYEKSYGVLIRIADRIEETPGTEDCEKIVVLGSLENSEKYSVNLTPEITGITDGYILRADDEVVGQSVLCSALNDYCGKNYSFLSGEEKQRISDLEQIKEMPAWPSQDCVTVLDEVIVIKLAVEGENK